MKIINLRSIILIISLILGIAVYVLWNVRYAAFVIILLALIFIGAFACILITGRNLKVEIEAPVQASKGMPADATVTISNMSRIPVLCCNIESSITNLLTDEKDHEQYAFSIGGRRGRKIEITVRPKHCGCVRIDASRVTVSDPMHIFNITPKNLVSSGDMQANIYYMPTAVESMINSGNISIYNMESNKYSALTHGTDPSETFDIKNYERGDSFKAIHWKLSSKADDLVVREFGLPIENNVMVIIDKNTDSNSPESADEFIEAAASLSFSLLKHEVNHTMAAYNHLSRGFETYRVDGIDSYWEAVKGMESGPFRKDIMSAVERYIESGADKDFSEYIYISEEGTDKDKLVTYGQVDLYGPKDIR